MYLSGGVGSGLGVVILVAVAAGAVLVTGRASAFLAAVATIAVLYEEFYVSLAPPDYGSDYFQAGVLGAIYFATSIGNPVAVGTAATHRNHVAVARRRSRGSRTRQPFDHSTHAHRHHRRRRGTIGRGYSINRRVRCWVSPTTTARRHHCPKRCSIDCTRGARIHACARARSTLRRPHRRFARTSARCDPSDPTPMSSYSSKTPSKFSSKRSNSSSPRSVGSPRASRTRSAIRSVQSATQDSCSASRAISTKAIRVSPTSSTCSRNG